MKLQFCSVERYCELWGVKVIKSDLWGKMGKSPFLGLSLITRKAIGYRITPKPFEILHELAHTVATNRVPEHSNEWGSMLGFEAYSARFLDAEEEWEKECGLLWFDNDTLFGNLPKHVQNDVFKKGRKAAVVAGLFTSRGTPTFTRAFLDRKQF